MNEFFEAISAPQNIAFTVALCFVIFYWVLVIVMGLGVELLDGAFHFFDHGGDLHAGDINPDTGLHTHIEGDMGPSHFVGATLRFLNFGDVPVTIIISVILLLAWLGNLILYGWSKDQSGLVQAGSVFAVCIAAVLISKLITSPLKAVFSSNEEKGPERTNLIGCDCILTMPVSETQSGQAEAKTPANRFIVVSVRSAPGQGPIPKGARGVIVSVDPDAGGYLVRLPGSEGKPSVGGKSK